MTGAQGGDIRRQVFAAVAKARRSSVEEVSEATPLIGDGGLDSMKLVELCLGLEDMATASGFEFDWTSETAMSRARSMFRSAGALADEYLAQRDAQA
jgi:acyl carrier protein